MNSVVLDGRLASLESPTSVIDKVLLVLQAFGEDEGLTLTELSRRTGIPKSTAHRLVGVLTQKRLLQKNGTKYSLGLLMFELGAGVRVQRELREVALPFLEDLYEATHEIIHLGVRAGNEVLYLEKLSGHKRASSPSRVGGRMPLHCTGLGKALLATAPLSVIKDVLSKPLPRRTPYTINSPRLLAEDLQRIAATGVAFDREEAQLGLVCAAAPVLDADGMAIAAISVTGPSPRVDPERLVYAVKTTSASLRRALGVVVPT